MGGCCVGVGGGCDDGFDDDWLVLLCSLFVVQFEKQTDLFQIFFNIILSDIWIRDKVESFSNCHHTDGFFSEKF